MHILTFKQPIQKVFHLPGAMLVSTSNDKIHRTEFNKHFLVKDGGATQLKYLKDGYIYDYENYLITIDNPFN